jgi:hypothetical protein
MSTLAIIGVIILTIAIGNLAGPAWGWAFMGSALIIGWLAELIWGRKR